MKIKLNNSRLKKLSEFIDGVKCINTIVYIYKNPTSKEISEVRNESQSIRGVITSSNDIFIWNGEILHDELLRVANNRSINIENFFRFANEEGGNWIFDISKLRNFHEHLNMLIGYKDILSKFGDIHESMAVYFGSENPKNEFSYMNIEYLKSDDVICGMGDYYIDFPYGINSIEAFIEECEDPESIFNNNNTKQNSNDDFSWNAKTLTYEERLSKIKEFISEGILSESIFEEIDINDDDDVQDIFDEVLEYKQDQAM